MMLVHLKRGSDTITTIQIRERGKTTDQYDRGLTPQPIAGQDSSETILHNIVPETGVHTLEFKVLHREGDTTPDSRYVINDSAYPNVRDVVTFRRYMKAKFHPMSHESGVLCEVQFYPDLGTGGEPIPLDYNASPVRFADNTVETYKGLLNRIILEQESYRWLSVTMVFLEGDVKDAVPAQDVSEE